MVREGRYKELGEEIDSEVEKMIKGGSGEKRRGGERETDEVGGRRGKMAMKNMGAVKVKTKGGEEDKEGGCIRNKEGNLYAALITAEVKALVLLM